MTKKITLELRLLEPKELIQVGDYYNLKGEPKTRLCFGAIDFYPPDFPDKEFWRLVKIS